VEFGEKYISDVRRTVGRVPTRLHMNDL